MTIIDCPWCHGPATTDDALLEMTCDRCGVSADIAPDPAGSVELEAAA